MQKGYNCILLEQHLEPFRSPLALQGQKLFILRYIYLMSQTLRKCCFNAAIIVSFYRDLSYHLTKIFKLPDVQK